MEPLRKEYLKEVLASCSDTIDANVHGGIDDSEHAVLALLIQNNLLLDKLCTLMFVATGLDEHDIPDDIGNTDLPNDIDNVHGVICGQCGKGVAPNRMGYCPKCGHDLRQQVAMEATRNKG